MSSRYCVDSNSSSHKFNFQVLLACLFLVIGFTLAFSIQFCHINEFRQPWKALVKTVSMMIGEFNYAEIFQKEDQKESSLLAARVAFLLFVILASIVLMNMMIGLAVDDIQILKKEGHMRRLQKRAEFLVQIENIASNRCVSSFVRGLVNRLHVDDVVRLDASVKVLTKKKLASKMNDLLFEITKSRKIADVRLNNANENVTVEQPLNNGIENIRVEQ
jgi:hypothetical protein